MQTDQSKITRKMIRSVLNRKSWESTKCDRSENNVANDEVIIVEKLLNGERLIQSRDYLADDKSYRVHWYWSDDACEFPPQVDWPVIRLWSRGVIRPVWCAGGATHIVLTNAARKTLGLPPARRPRPM